MAKKGSSGGTGKKIIYTLIALLVVILSAVAWKIYENVFAQAINIEDGKEAYLYVRSGKTLEELLTDIGNQKLLRNQKGFEQLVKLLGYESKLKPGRYKVDAHISNLYLLRLLASGRQEAFDVVFVGAQRKTDFAGFWSRQLEADSAAIIDMLNDSAWAKSNGLNTENILTLFIPNTYNFYWNTPAIKLLKRMQKAYTDFWDSTKIEKAARLHLSQSEVSILASIVQKETAKTDEMPAVAGVYFNRLQHRMPLQADPTILFVINDKSVKRVAGEMLKVQSPYNTYQNIGLPPGPICIPSVQAIHSVLNLEKHHYLYFCAKSDFSGYHAFASSFAQHQVNARQYQRALNQRGIH